METTEFNKIKQINLLRSFADSMHCESQKDFSKVLCFEHKFWEILIYNLTAQVFPMKLLNISDGESKSG